MKMAAPLFAFFAKGGHDSARSADFDFAGISGESRCAHIQPFSHAFSAAAMPSMREVCWTLVRRLTSCGVVFTRRANSAGRTCCWIFVEEQNFGGEAGGSSTACRGRALEGNTARLSSK